MADRGFNVQTKLDSISVTLIIPQFLRKTAPEEILAKRIARVRIHVERANKIIKDYSTLTRNKFFRCSTLYVC